MKPIRSLTARAILEEPPAETYEAYDRYLEEMSSEQPYYTFAGWLRAGQPKGENCLDKR